MNNLYFSVGCSLGVFWFLGFLCCSLHFSFSLLRLLRLLYWSLGSAFTWNHSNSKNPPNVLSSKHKPFFSPLGCDALEGAMLVVVLSSSKSRLQSHLQPETFSPAPCLCEEGRAKMLWQHISVSWVEHPAPHSSVLKISEINRTNYDFRFKPSPTSSKSNWSHCFISNCDQVFPRTAVFAPNLYGGNL